MQNNSLVQRRNFSLFKRCFAFYPSEIIDPAPLCPLAIISLAKNLGLKTIAEGVETVEQLDLLRERCCDEVQGFYYSKPLPAEQFEAFAANFRIPVTT